MNPDAPALRDFAAELRRSVVLLAWRVREARGPGAMGVRKVSVLSHLYRLGSATAGDIAAADRLQPQSLTRVFAELEHDGLIARSRSDQDRRQAILTLTEAGREQLARHTAGRDEWLAAALAELTDTEICVLRVAAGLLGRLADTRSEG